MPLDLTPIEAINLNGKVLSLHELSRESALRLREHDGLDYLGNARGQPTLFVQYGERYQAFLDTFGESTEASLNEIGDVDGRVIPVRFARCSPEQYAGRSFTTKHTYGITEDSCFSTREKTNGLKIDLIAGLDRSLKGEALACLSLRNKVGLNYLLMSKGTDIMPGKIVALSLNDNARGEIGFATSIVGEISPEIL